MHAHQTGKKQTILNVLSISKNVKKKTEIHTLLILVQIGANTGIWFGPYPTKDEYMQTLELSNSTSGYITQDKKQFYYEAK